MSDPSSHPAAARAEELISEGLRLYGAGLEGAAVERWRDALALEPNHPLALDYLRSSESTAATAATAATAREPGTVLEFHQRRAEPRSAANAAHRQQLVSEVEDLLRRERIDEALALLRLAHHKEPGDPEVEVAIARLEARRRAAQAPPPSADSGAPDPDRFNELFRAATTASLRGERDEARRLLLHCAELRPGDLRVRANLQQLDRLQREGAAPGPRAE